MMYYLINGFIGAFIAVLISYIGKTNLYMLAGLIPLFPTFTLLAQINAHYIGGDQQLKEVIIFGLLAMIPYLIYTLSLYFSLTQNIKFLYAGIIAVCIWIFAALFVLYLAKKFTSI